MNSNIMIPVLLQLVGVGVIIAEFIIPSGGLLSLTAVGVFAYSLFHVFTTVSPEAGTVFVAVDIVMIPVSVLVGIKLLASSPVALRKTLSSDNGVTSQDPSLQELPGKDGITVTRLRPAGKALIDGKRFDVVSMGDFIEKDTAVVVTAVEGNRIVVKNRNE